MSGFHAMEPTWEPCGQGCACNRLTSVCWGPVDVAPWPGYVLWGSHPNYAVGEPIKLTGGTLQECQAAQRRREADGGWTLALYKAGTAPVGLRVQVA